MIKSIIIPINISLKILKKNNKYLIILKKNLNDNLKRELFLLSNSEIFNKNRVILSNKNTINIINQGIIDLNLWNNRKIELKGVGSKVELKENILNIKVSNTSKSYKIPKDINIKIINSPLSIILWGTNINVIDKFKNLIIKNLPKKSLIWTK